MEVRVCPNFRRPGVGLRSAARAFAAVSLASGTAIGIFAQSPKSQWDGVYSEAQAARGEPLYVENCSMCHGLNAAGTILAPALAGPTFTAKWNRRPLAMVFEIIQTQMPLNLSGHLSAQQNADVLAYILKRGDGPAGAQELPAGADALESIVVLQQKP